MDIRSGWNKKTLKGVSQTPDTMKGMNMKREIKTIIKDCRDCPNIRFRRTVETIQYLCGKNPDNRTGHIQDTKLVKPLEAMFKNCKEWDEV